MPDARPRRGSWVVEIVVAAMVIVALIVLSYHPGNRKILTLELAARKFIATVHGAQTTYHLRFGKYAASVEELGLSSGMPNGYRFTLEANPTCYRINADPVVYNTTGRRAFFSDETFILHENYGPEPGTAQSMQSQ